MNLNGVLRDLVFPQSIYCVICGKYIDSKRKYALCSHCIKRMNFKYTEFDWGDKESNHYLDYGFSAMGYGMYERRLIFNLKYNGKTYMAPILADIIYDAIYCKVAETGGSCLFEGDIIIPVPIHRRRLNERGFNQTEKIARHLGEKLLIPVESKALVRDRQTGAQRALSMKDRQLNMQNAFKVLKHREKDIQDKIIILLDDIYTTGSTMLSCAKCLKEHGAKKIYGITLLFAGNRHHLMVE